MGAFLTGTVTTISLRKSVRHVNIFTNGRSDSSFCTSCGSGLSQTVASRIAHRNLFRGLNGLGTSLMRDVAIGFGPRSRPESFRLAPHGRARALRPQGSNASGFHEGHANANDSARALAPQVYRLFRALDPRFRSTRTSEGSGGPK